MVDPEREVLGIKGKTLNQTNDNRRFNIDIFRFGIFDRMFVLLALCPKR